VVWRDSANGIFPISGRYADAGGDMDYKMSSYFKAKAKALLESGVNNVKVLSVWDEEYKLFYLSFHDSVNEDNNETIVFHEPSNKWLCFAKFESVDHDGYNVIMELNYDVVKGFESGIGYEFDEATRFAIFSIITTSSVSTNALDLLPITITLFEPTLLISGTPTISLQNITFTLQSPTVVISYVHSSVATMTFDAEEGGYSDNQSTVITCSPDSYLTSMPDWITVADWFYDIINVDDGFTLLRSILAQRERVM
jgi:hypothetical protein